MPRVSEPEGRAIIAWITTCKQSCKQSSSRFLWGGISDVSVIAIFPGIIGSHDSVVNHLVPPVELERKYHVVTAKLSSLITLVICITMIFLGTPYSIASCLLAHHASFDRPRLRRRRGGRGSHWRLLSHLDFLRSGGGGGAVPCSNLSYV